MNRYGIHQVTIPLPYWNDHVHCYLVNREGRWTIIDTAMNRKETRESWMAAFSEHGIDPQRDIERILITHHHPDHFEYAGELQLMSGTDVFLSDSEYSLALNVLDAENFTAFNLSAGMPKNLVKKLQQVNKSTTRMPSTLKAIEVNGRYKIGELFFEALHMPGHSDGHICFYNWDEQILISGDHLTRETIPYISYHGYGDKNPLGTYINTLKSMQLMDISLVLPGHGPIFSDAKERINELLNHFEKRLEKILDYVAKESSSYEVSRALVPRGESAFEQWIALGEVNACLRYLVAKGEININTEETQFKYKASV